MKKNKYLIIIISIVFLILSAFLFFWQMNVRSALTRDLKIKNDELRKTKSVNDNLTVMESRNSELERRQRFLYKKVPLAVKQPLDLIKDIAKLAGDAGLREVSFSIKEAQESGDASGSNKNVAGSTLPQGKEHSGKAENKDNSEDAQGKHSTKTKNVKPAQPQVKSILITMDCQGLFADLAVFLDNLGSLNRLVVVSSIQIKRNLDILPLLEISLELNTYTYPAP